MAKLSIIIPVYNGAGYLKETIEHILASEYKDFEIVIVNDGSTDNSADIARKMQMLDKRIVLYSKANEGVISSRNYGVEKASGEYICFVDQDDIVKPFMYARLLNAIEENNSDMAICSSGRYIDGKESGYDILSDGVYRGLKIREELLFPILFNGFDVSVNYGRGNHYPSIWTCVFKRSFWDACGLRFRAYINFEDDLLVKVEALSKASCVSTVSDIGYLWRVNLESETYSHHFVENIGQKQEQAYLDMKESLTAFNPNKEFMESFKQVTYCKQYVDAIHNMSSPEVKKSLKFIRQYCEQNIYARDFENAIKARHYLKKGRVKPGVILPLLSRHKSAACYVSEIILDKILLFTLHSQFLTKLERMIKK